MQVRIVLEYEAKIINDTLFPHETLQNTIELINSKIIPLEQQIIQVMCEQNGEVNYVFIAMFVDDFNVEHDPNKVLFINLANYIITKGGSVHFDDIMMFNDEMSAKKLEVFLTNKYLIVDKCKNIFLSPLAIKEMEVYLNENFVDRKCSGCLNIVVYGIECESCKKLAHGPCLIRYFENVGSEKCLNCSKRIRYEWNPLIVFNEFDMN